MKMEGKQSLKELGYSDEKLKYFKHNGKNKVLTMKEKEILNLDNEILNLNKVLEKDNLTEIERDYFESQKNVLECHKDDIKEDDYEISNRVFGYYKMIDFKEDFYDKSERDEFLKDSLELDKDAFKKEVEEFLNQYGEVKNKVLNKMFKDVEMFYKNVGFYNYAQVESLKYRCELLGKLNEWARIETNSFYKEKVIPSFKLFFNNVGILTDKQVCLMEKREDFIRY